MGKGFCHASKKQPGRRGALHASCPAVLQNKCYCSPCSTSSKTSPCHKRAQGLKHVEADVACGIERARPPLVKTLFRGVRLLKPQGPEGPGCGLKAVDHHSTMLLVLWGIPVFGFQGMTV